MDYTELIKKAFDMLEYSYVPYSHFTVGAALLCDDGSVVGGCNIENASYGATNCAERTAFFKAIYDGVYDFSSVPYHEIDFESLTPVEAE